MSFYNNVVIDLTVEPYVVTGMYAVIDLDAVPPAISIPNNAINYNVARRRFQQNPEASPQYPEALPQRLEAPPDNPEAPPQNPEAPPQREIKTFSDASTQLTANKYIYGCCPICWKKLGKYPCASTKCGHLYCMRCIKRYLDTVKRCPSCRRSLKSSNAYHPVYLYDDDGDEEDDEDDDSDDSDDSDDTP